MPPTDPPVTPEARSRLEALLRELQLGGDDLDLEHSGNDRVKARRLLREAAAKLQRVTRQQARLRAEVFELLTILEAQAQLAAGFKGMGVNIVIEKAGKLAGQRRRLQKLLDEAALVPEETPP